MYNVAPLPSCKYIPQINVNMLIAEMMWVCLKIVYPIVPNGFADHYPYEKWLFHWEYTQHFQTNPCSCKPTCLSKGQTLGFKPPEHREIGAACTAPDEKKQNRL